MKILIIDDEQRLLDALSIGFQFQWQDAVVLTAHNGDEGLRVFYDHTPDVVLLDVGMPGMSGYEVAAALQADPGTAGACLIAITGYGQEEDRRQAHEAGFNHHLVKPLDPRTLQALVESSAG